METRNNKRKLIDLDLEYIDSINENNKKTIQSNITQNIQIKVERIFPHNQYDISVEFDYKFFEDSSNAWRENKIKIKNGEFRYKRSYS